VAQNAPIFQGMIKLAAAIIGLAGLGLPVAHHALPAAPKSVEQQLLTKVNSGPDGRITRSVTCRKAGEARYSCSLHGLSLTSPARMSVHVVARGGSLQPAYGPVEG
jgi:hypothetical protein